MASSSTRPVTSKARGVCRYYNVPRGCFAGDKCKFLHGEPPVDLKPENPPFLTPYDKAKRCRYFAEGFCKRGDACWFLHTSDSKDKAPTLDEDDEEYCSICFEKPATYGLLGGCSHIFCITCIRQWRDPQNKPGGVLDSGNTKKCPMCRATSKFIIPSSKFWKSDTAEKDRVTQTYKESMGRVPCRYFQKSLQKNKETPLCPYGKDCFYQHIMEDGTPYVFKDGVDICMRRYHLSQGHGMTFDDVHFMPLPLDFSSLDNVPRAGLFFSDGVRLEIEARNDGSRNRRGNAGDATTHAGRRLHEVGRSLERLNDAITEGATLESLNLAVQALRAGLGRLEGVATEEQGASREETTFWTEEDSEGNGDEAAAQEEDEVMERLEILADQMLASISALRLGGEAGNVRVNRDGAETPPPPLEPIDESTPPPLIPMTERSRVRDFDEASQSSMPGLANVTNSSSSEAASDSSDDDSDDDDERNNSHALDFVDGETSDTVEEWLLGRLASYRPNDPGPSSGRFSTVVDRAADDDDDDDDDSMPGLEEIEPSAPSSSDPPFVTDGRGRVVWSSAAEENKGAGFTTDGWGRVISVGAGSEAEGSASPAAGTGSNGRSLLGWINALF